METNKRKDIDNFVAEWMVGNRQNVRFDRENNIALVKVNDKNERWNIQFLLEELIVAWLEQKDKEWLSVRIPKQKKKK
jgi:hypothetical protein